MANISDKYVYIEITKDTGLYRHNIPWTNYVKLAKKGEVYRVSPLNKYGNNIDEVFSTTITREGKEFKMYKDSVSGLYILSKKPNSDNFTSIELIADTNSDNMYGINKTASSQSINNSRDQTESNREDDERNINESAMRNNRYNPNGYSAGSTPGQTGIVDESFMEESDTYSTEVNSFLDPINYGDTSVAEMNMDSVSSVLGVFGMPYQFLPHVDPRINTGGITKASLSELGSDYADRIVGSMPILFLSPGKPSFMSGYSNDNEKITIQEMIQSRVSGSEVNIDRLMSKNGKFYTFEYAVTEYYNYVNPMCRITAQLLDICEEQYSISDKTNDSLDWRDITQKQAGNIHELITNFLAIPFYIDTETQISEQFSNDVTDSSLAGTVDGFSEMGRELMFYLGYTPALAGFDSLSAADLLDNTEIVQKYVSAIDDNNIFKSLANQITAVATGGRIQFPKIWTDSTFSRSYDVTIKLRSPDMDNLSLWVNIIVPLCHILGFVQPRMIANNPNAYSSPFLVRAMYKGFFNVDMGIISSCSINKGDDAQWSINGIPTTVDVNLTITDLYDTMSITPGNDLLFDTLDNTAQMDYLMNLCGINMYKPELERVLDLYFVHHKNMINDAIGNIFSTIRDKISTGISNIYRGLL